MLQTLKDLFEAIVPPAANAPRHQAQHTLHLAAAVLLAEVMRSDAQIEPAERAAVLAALRSQLALSPDEGERLLEVAEQTARDATDYFAFTSKINQSFEMEQKLEIIESMWCVAYADGTLSAHENHLMRKVADLLHVPQGASMNAKMRARQ